MDFSIEEIICMNTFLDRKPIAGLPLQWRYSGEEEAQAIQTTVQSLKDKGYVQEDGTFNLEGTTVLKLLQLYKAATTKVFINHMRVGFLENQRVVILALAFDDQLALKGVTMQLNGRAELFFGLLNTYPDLCKSYKPFFVPRSYQLPLLEFYQQLKPIPMQNIIYLSKPSQEDGERYETRVYYWNEEACSTYHYETNICEEWEVGAIRKCLAEALEVSAYE